MGENTKGCRMSKSNELNIISKAHKQALKIANETAARTGTLLVSCEGTKVKLVRPNVRYMGFEPVSPSPKNIRSKK